MSNLRDVRTVAEHNLIAALLVLRDPGYVKDVSAVVCPKDFHDSQFLPPLNQHYRIFIAMQTLAALGQTVNQVTVATKLYESIKESHGGDMGHRECSDIAEMSLMLSELECAMDYMEYAKSIAALAHPEGTKQNRITVPIERR